MATLKKLSKSDPAPTPSYEVLAYLRKDGTTAWLWACEQGCYDDSVYDKTSREDTERVANRHVATVHA